MLQAAKVATVIPAVRKLRPEETLAQFAAPLQEQVTIPRTLYDDAELILDLRMVVACAAWNCI